VRVLLLDSPFLTITYTQIYAGKMYWQSGNLSRTCVVVWKVCRVMLGQTACRVVLGQTACRVVLGQAACRVVLGQAACRVVLGQAACRVVLGQTACRVVLGQAACRVVLGQEKEDLFWDRQLTKFFSVGMLADVGLRS